MTISAIINDTDNVVFQSRLDSVEVFIISNEDEVSPLYPTFTVRWGDYIANAWEEKYDSLGVALARAAVIVHASEICSLAGSGTSEFAFRQSDSSEFTTAWEVAMNDFAEFIED